MYLLHADNDTVLISMWRGGGMRSTECCLIQVSMLVLDSQRLLVLFVLLCLLLRAIFVRTINTSA